MSTKREKKLDDAITRLEKALLVANSLKVNAGGLNDISEEPVLGVLLLQEMDVIEVIETDSHDWFAIVKK